MSEGKTLSIWDKTVKTYQKKYGKVLDRPGSTLDSKMLLYTLWLLELTPKLTTVNNWVNKQRFPYEYQVSGAIRKQVLLNGIDIQQKRFKVRDDTYPFKLSTRLTVEQIDWLLVSFSRPDTETLDQLERLRRETVKRNKTLPDRVLRYQSRMEGLMDAVRKEAKMVVCRSHTSAYDNFQTILLKHLRDIGKVEVIKPPQRTENVLDGKVYITYRLTPEVTFGLFDLGDLHVLDGYFHSYGEDRTTFIVADGKVRITTHYPEPDFRS